MFVLSEYNPPLLFLPPPLKKDEVDSGDRENTVFEPAK